MYGQRSGHQLSGLPRKDTAQEGWGQESSEGEKWIRGHTMSAVVCASESLTLGPLSSLFPNRRIWHKCPPVALLPVLFLK